MGTFVQQNVYTMYFLCTIDTINFYIVGIYHLFTFSNYIVSQYH